MDVLKANVDLESANNTLAMLEGKRTAIELALNASRGEADSALLALAEAVVADGDGHVPGVREAVRVGGELAARERVADTALGILAARIIVARQAVAAAEAALAADRRGAFFSERDRRLRELRATVTATFDALTTFRDWEGEHSRDAGGGSITWARGLWVDLRRLVKGFESDPRGRDVSDAGGQP